MTLGPLILDIKSLSENIVGKRHKRNRQFPLFLKKYSTPLKVAVQIFGQKFYKITKNHPYTPKAF